MNTEDLKILREESVKYPTFFNNVKVLELGSRNINGSVRVCFNNCYFIGVDWIDGKDVDLRCKFGETTFKENTFDTLISFSSFEHDPYWEKDIRHNLQWLRGGGMVFFNWAGENSSIHGIHYAADIKGEPTGAIRGTKDLDGTEPKGGYYPHALDDMIELLNWNSVTVIMSKTLGRGTLHVTGVKNG